MKISLNKLLSSLKFRVLLKMREFDKCANYIEIGKANITEHVTNEKNMFSWNLSIFKTKLFKRKSFSKRSLIRDEFCIDFHYE